MSTLLIVESPTKAKTISKFLGKDYTVLSSFGHVRDLPKSKMGVDVEHGFAPTYVVPAKSKSHVTELKRAAKKADTVLLATDEDREGEAIAWHVAELLDLKGDRVRRIHFNEITKQAIEKALEHPRALDTHLVDAQQTRRILDRLVGYELSPLLWKKIRYGLSAGRVQSVALRLVVERERERLAFKQDEFWTIDALFEKNRQSFPGRLFSVDGKKLDKLAIQTEDAAKKIAADVQGAAFAVTDIQKKTVTKSPAPPFTTSGLQIDANNRLGFSAKQTMMLAQQLYETGRITYMRTDSVNLAEKFQQETQAFLAHAFGQAYAAGPRAYKTKSKGAQEAHEAIRPTDATATPEHLQSDLDPRQAKLYDLIWRRAVASQMPNAQLERTSVDVEAKQYAFRANGNIVSFDGFLRVYQGGKETLLPALTKGDAVIATSLTPTQHFTQPPARFSDATLVKSLEEFGIGRPSTYAPTISTLLDREYVQRDEQKKLFPTDTGLIVTDLLVEHFPQIVDFQFTATMENGLDEVAEGKRAWQPMLSEFYHPFHELVESKNDNLTKADVMKERSLGMDVQSGKEVFVRTGRFGPHVQLGKEEEQKLPEGAEKPKRKKKEPKDPSAKPKHTSLLRTMSMETVTLPEALALLALPRIVGKTKEGEEIMADIGRFGPYLKSASATSSIPEPHNILTLDEAVARELLETSAARKKLMATPIAELGSDPASGGAILIKHGRFGPYITDGITHVSVPKKLDPEALTHEQAVELLAKKRARKK